MAMVAPPSTGGIVELRRINSQGLSVTNAAQGRGVGRQALAHVAFTQFSPTRGR